jgi:hypothetical protein
VLGALGKRDADADRAAAGPMTAAEQARLRWQAFGVGWRSVAIGVVLTAVVAGISMVFNRW